YSADLTSTDDQSLFNLNNHVQLDKQVNSYLNLPNSKNLAINTNHEKLSSVPLVDLIDMENGIKLNPTRVQEVSSLPRVTPKISAIALEGVPR
ncbi:hypothetical protein ABFV54_26975, partial [Pseudomonas syringae]|uniref:hypothetical protein n=1 Tax=Pseudomonas syringae TaxID=317 RepID=UPI0034D5FCD9